MSGDSVLRPPADQLPLESPKTPRGTGDRGLASAASHTGVKGVAWLPLVTFSQAAVGTQGSGLVVVTSEAAVREARNAETGVGCPPAFADGGRAAASAPRTEGGACLCSTLAASRPTVGGQGRHPAGETHPLLARRPAPSCPLPSSCRSGRPCRSSARTTK